MATLQQSVTSKAHTRARPPSRSRSLPLKAKAIETSLLPAVNVAAVPQRSLLRYPGGKTWLIPHIRAWLAGVEPAPKLFIEPFAGGGIASLTAVMEDLAERCLMVEIDHDVAAFWHAVLQHGDEMARRIEKFVPTRESIDALTSRSPENVLEHGFRTLVLNRTRRGGILAAGASLARAGENGKGVASRWYPETLTRRLEAIAEHSSRINFCEADGMKFLEVASDMFDSNAVAFIDPPYTVGGKRAGSRLYAHNEVDHARLFEMLADRRLEFLMTYDASGEAVELVGRYKFHAVRVMMKNTHHNWMPEMVITPRPMFVK